MNYICLQSDKLDVFGSSGVLGGAWALQIPLLAAILHRTVLD